VNLFHQHTSGDCELFNLARWALHVAVRAVPTYDSKFSPKAFTRPQLLACLIIKQAMGLTYRGMCDTLRSSLELREILGLASTPHYTTLESYANGRYAQEVAMHLLDALWRWQNPREHPVSEAAMDSSGLGKTNASVYFEAVRSQRQPPASASKGSLPSQQRVDQRGVNSAENMCCASDSRRKNAHASEAQSTRDQRRFNTPFIKISVIVACGTLIPLAVVATIGRSNDKQQAYTLVAQGRGRVGMTRLYADKGYDSEALHEFCRHEHDVELVAPPIIQARDGKAHTRYRSAMVPLPEGYAKRSHVESFFSAMKRVTGSSLRARTTQSQLREAVMRVICYGIRRIE
jgi:hypothetical protein